MLMNVGPTKAGVINPILQVCIAWFQLGLVSPFLFEIIVLSRNSFEYCRVKCVSNIL